MNSVATDARKRARESSATGLQRGCDQRNKS